MRLGFLRAMLAIGAAITAADDYAADKVSDDKATSIKLFEQAAQIMQHPRCANCHASGDAPRQGDDKHAHTLAVKRGPKDRGVPGLTCNVCHQDRNMAGIPGALDWHMAPAEMAWGGASASEICRALTDTKRNGNRLPKGVALHVENDALVVWAWQPGEGRSAPPLSHRKFVDLMRRWGETGAYCPD
jgi:hypothetical protein